MWIAILFESFFRKIRHNIIRFRPYIIKSKAILVFIVVYGYRLRQKYTQKKPFCIDMIKVTVDVFRTFFRLTFRYGYFEWPRLSHRVVCAAIDVGSSVCTPRFSNEKKIRTVFFSIRNLLITGLDPFLSRLSAIFYRFAYHFRGFDPVSFPSRLFDCNPLVYNIFVPYRKRTQYTIICYTYT